MKASARKSLGEYKPLIIHASGRTEVIGKREATGYQARVEGKERYRRGLTFTDRAAAMAYAQRHIDRLIEDRARRDRQRAERHARYAEQSN